MGEYGFGRWAKKGAMGAYDEVLRLKGLRFGRCLGVIPVLTVWGVFIFYAIVAGWGLRYFFSSISGTYLRAESFGTYFHQFAGQLVSVFWQFLAIVFTGSIIAFGIAKGIERTSKFIMPATFAYGLDPAAGPPLLFITIFEKPEVRILTSAAK